MTKLQGRLVAINAKRLPVVWKEAIVGERLGAVLRLADVGVTPRTEQTKQS